MPEFSLDAMREVFVPDASISGCWTAPSATRAIDRPDLEHARHMLARTGAFAKGEDAKLRMAREGNEGPDR